MRQWVTKATNAQRKAESQNCKLPDIYLAYLLLRRSGLARDDRRNVLVSTGGTLSVDNVTAALKKLYPDDELAEYDRNRHSRARLGAAHHSDDDDSGDDEDPAVQAQTFAAMMVPSMAPTWI